MVMTFDSLNIPGSLYFITATVVGWTQLFQQPVYAQIVLDSLAYLRTQKFTKLFAFVLLPSHLHAIVKPEGISIDTFLQEFRSFTAHKILKQLKQDHASELLQYFHEQRRDRSRVHSIWQDIQAKNILSNETLAQEMEYIHQNPDNKEWHLVENRADYIYSSACFYDRNQRPIIEIDDIRDLF